jgi:hypothetical protein
MTTKSTLDTPARHGMLDAKKDARRHVERARAENPHSDLTKFLRRAYRWATAKFDRTPETDEYGRSYLAHYASVMAVELESRGARK